MNTDTLAKYIALQVKFGEVMGRWKELDRGYCLKHNSHYYFGDHLSEQCCDEEGIRIPLTCDDSSEEARARSLWGMVDWKEDAIPLITLCPCPDGKVDLSIDNGEGFQESYIHTDLTDALLSALCEQWGVEVEG